MTKNVMDFRKAMEKLNLERIIYFGLDIKEFFFELEGAMCKIRP